MKLSIWWPTYGNTTVVLPYSLSLTLSPTLPHLRGFSVWLMRPGLRPTLQALRNPNQTSDEATSMVVSDAIVRNPEHN